MGSKKILFFISITYIGGAETHVIRLSKELSKLGYEIHFLSLVDNGPFFNFVNEYSMSCNILHSPLSNPFQLLKSINHYRKILKKYRFDLVFNFGFKVEIFSILFTRIFSFKTKIISNIRSTDKYKLEIQKFIYSMFTLCSNAIISNSIAGKNVYQYPILVYQKKIKVIYNYVDNEKDLTEIKLQKIQLPTIKIGVLANIKKLKGHFDLIPIAKLLIAKGYNPIFICAGVDYTKNNFFKMIKTNDLIQNFEIIKYIEDKQNFFNQIDIFFLPSYYEGMPTAVLESMVYKKPIITTNIDGMLEQIDNGVNGFLVSPGDINGFANAIIELAINPRLVEKFVSNALITIENKFKKEEKIKAWVAVIENL